MMLSNVKNLFFEIFQFFKNISFRDGFKKSIGNAKESIDEFKYKINHLFETNLQNGLTHYYDNHFYDALTRFQLMNTMWRNNPIVNYNLGRTYFALKKHDKANNFLIKAANLNPDENYKILIEYYKKKIDNVHEIVSTPENLKEEFYNYSMNSLVTNEAVNNEKTKKIFDLYNRYIGSLVVEKNEDNVSILELGSFIGNHGMLIKKEFKKINLDGVDISEKMQQRCKGLFLEKNNEDEIKIYNNVYKEEMHKFLSDNTISFHKSLREEIQQKKEEENSPKLYDIILAINSFSDFGELSVAIKLSELNLLDNGFLIFSVPKSTNGGIQFSTTNDYFFYNSDYVENILNETQLTKIDIIEYEVDNEKQMMFILKKAT